MRKIIAFLLALTLIFSSAVVFASAEHTHKAGLYVDELKTEYRHTFFCKICGEAISQIHSFDENGNCDCGYFDHEHNATTYPVYTESLHTFTCTECKIAIVEDHKLDENSECACGYVDHEHAARVYSVINVDGHHTYVCKYCGATITEEHEMNENGECVCGYTDHTHTTDAYGITEYAHLYYCTECITLVTEQHTFDENGKCECGYTHPDKASVFEAMFQPFKMMISNFRFYMSAFKLGFKAGAGLV